MFWCVVAVWALAAFRSVDSLFVGDTCTANDVPGTCRLLPDCQPLLDEIGRAGKPMPSHVRIKLQKLSCGFQSSQPIVCCVENNRIKPTDDDRNKNGHIVSNNIDDSPVDISKHRNIRLLPTECGFFEGDRIFGGRRIGLYDMPWMVLIEYNSARGVKLSCGGTLINEWYVLTAAHCVAFLGKRLTLQSVRLGEHDTRQDPDCERLEGQETCAPNYWNVSLAAVLPHPGYSPQNLFDDIALIRLSRAANFDLATMKPICLPASSELQSEDLVGRNATVVGWGATEDGLQSPVRLIVDLPIVSNTDCQAVYNGNPRIYPRQLCAGGEEDRDACGGDSGGPLMYPGATVVGTRYVQRGIVSYGSKRCGIGGFPGVYTSVAHYMDWILDNIEP